MFASKGAVREMANEIDKVARKAATVVQSDIDRIADKIDAELHSCGRELTSASTTLGQIKPLIDRLVIQVREAGAPDSIQIILGSVAQEVMSKVTSATGNVTEVQKNIKDVDAYTDAIDKKTDEVSKLMEEIDSITDRYQK